MEISLKKVLHSLKGHSVKKKKNIHIIWIQKNKLKYIGKNMKALWIRDMKPSINVKDEYKSR